MYVPYEWPIGKIRPANSSLTMTDISQELGISIGGLYYHYHSVEEILLDIINVEQV